jgi:CubicO group peptidase (beta-lactamase class C family)
MSGVRSFAIRVVLVLAVVGLPVSAAIAAEEASPRDHTVLDRIFDDAMARYDLPGMAMGVIDNGEVVHVRTGGELAAGSGQPVTPESLFKIASNSKAMTTSVLARLVDAGKLRWEDPVTRHLPQFRMLDPWVTREMQVRDLLIHNSGLREGAGDLMLWPEPNRFDRDDIIAGLAHLKPQQSFRAGYAYDNLLYVVAGEVAAAAGGAPYETLVRRELFEPLGLSRCRVGGWRRGEVDNVAQPHMRSGDRNIVIRADEAVVPAITSAAAGGIRCSLDDMLAWARNWLAPTPQQLEWLSAEQRREVWAPRTIMPIAQRRRDWDDTHFYAYGYGWRLADVDGVWTVSHTGTLAGMYSVMTLLPDRKSGFVVLINGEGSAARTVLNEVLLKHFTSPAAAATVAEYAARLDAEPPAPDHVPMPDTSSRRPVGTDDMPSRLGIYRDPWFDEVSLCGHEGKVRFVAAKSPRLSGQLMIVDGRHLVDWADDTVDAEAWVDFADGTQDFTMAKVDPQADFSFDFEDLAFTRVRSCE